MPNNLHVAIIDCEIGNLFSIKRACEYVGLNPVITTNKSTIVGSEAIILPGVGAFGDAMNSLERLDLIATIKEFIETGKPFMGICLGMQLLLSESEEFGNHKGLDIINGSVVKFSVKNGENEKNKVPQVGWNQIFKPPFANEDYWDKSPLKYTKNGEYMYFVHSYYVIPNSYKNILTISNYAGIEYASSIVKDNIFAFQFHPELSGIKGIEIFKNFKTIITEGSCYDST